MICRHQGCEKSAEEGKDECFRHRVMTVGYSWKGGAVVGRHAFHMTKRDFMEQHFDGATSDKDMLKRSDIEKV